VRRRVGRAAAGVEVQAQARGFEIWGNCWYDVFGDFYDDPEYGRMAVVPLGWGCDDDDV
jgi:hypothetical protein